MVRDRASQLAAVRGCPAHEANKSDWDEARRQLSPENTYGTVDGTSGDVRMEGPGNAIPESEVPFGSEAADSALDERERSDEETLVMEGMAAAERDIRSGARAEQDGESSDDRNP